MPEVTLELLGQGKSQKFTKLEVRMGRDPGCDVVFRSEEFPMVGRQHAVLLSSSGGWTVEDLHSTNGTFVNQVRIQRQPLAPGDTVRLGSDGPEIRVQFVDQAFAETAKMAGVTATTVSPAPTIPPTAAHPGELPSTRAAQLAATAPPQIAATKPSDPPPTRPATAPPVAPAGVPPGATIAPTKPSPAGYSAPARTIEVSAPESTEPESSSQVSAPEQQEEISEDEDPMNDQKLSLLRNLVILMVGLVLVLGGIVISQMQQLSDIRQNVTDMRAEAKTAVAKFTPELDQRMNKIESNMDAMDERMQKAQDKFMKQIDAELPKVLDKYVDKKMKELSAQAPAGIAIPR
jgi:FHA domain